MITIPHFGSLDPLHLEEYYDVTIDYRSDELTIDLNFDNDSIDPQRLERVAGFLGRLEEYFQKNQQYIEDDYTNEDGDTVRTYLEHHIEELGEEELKGLVDFDNSDVSPTRQLLKSLKPVRLGLYPDRDESFATFDYSIGQELTQYLVVIFTDAEGKLDYMTMES